MEWMKDRMDQRQNEQFFDFNIERSNLKDPMYELLVVIKIYFVLPEFKLITNFMFRFFLDLAHFVIKKESTGNLLDICFLLLFLLIFLPS